MPRAIWSGSISFGLVNVPVKAYTAVRDHTVHFHQLEKKSGARIKNQKVSAKSGDPVDSDDIELGYEIRKGRHVTFERSELDDLRPESTKAVEVSDFVALEDIDPIYYERTYWLGPDGDAAAKAYQLLLAAMEDRQRVGIGSVVMRNKQYLAAIRPLDGALAMSTMRFADEVVPQSDIDAIPSRRSKPDAKSARLAGQIIDSLENEWDPSRYHDTYTEELQDIIERKDKGKTDTVVDDEGDDDEGGEVLDLMAALEASVSSARARRQGSGTAKGTRTRKAAGGSSRRASSTRKASSSRKSATKKAPARKRAAARKSA